ncbi:MAG: agmatinase family protein [Phycisphaerales bacterium JB039]
MTFDPDGPAIGGGVFGLPHTRQDARVVLLGVPFDATTSYRAGTAAGPEAIRAASMQVDLRDHRFGNIYEAGIWMAPHDERIAALSRRAREFAAPIIEAGGAGPDDAEALDQVDSAGELVRETVRAFAAGALADGRLCGVIGGEHSVSLGAIEASCATGPIGVLQIDAHMDLREAYEGFRYSHASIMHNALEMAPSIERLVQVGIRDYSDGELRCATESGRVTTFFDDDLFDRFAAGQAWGALCEEILAALPQRVHVSVDIDGLDPSLCPNTGTPVPGGLSFRELSLLLAKLAESGRTIVGFDLVEVCPGAGRHAPEWDANVGARVLYRLCGAAITSAAEH